jgi:hypothetical protein
MPESVADVPRLLPPAIKLVYNWAKIIGGTCQYIRSVSSIVALEDNDDQVCFPPCFVAENSSGNKRKSDDISL